MEANANTVKPGRFARGVLVISALFILYPVIGTLFLPIAFYQAVDVDLRGQITLLNELKGGAALLAAIAFYQMAGAVSGQWTLSALRIGAVGYLSYWAGRMFSLVSDGMPQQDMVIVAILEGAMGLLCLIAAMRVVKKTA